MNHVIRRLIVLFLCSLALAGCGAADGRDALTVGDRSISESGLTDLVVAVNGGAPDDEIPGVLPADIYRQIGITWISDAAAATYLEDNGITITESERESIKLDIEDAIANAQLGAISRESDGYEALTTNVWVASQQAALAEPGALDAIRELIQNADVGSRFGAVEFDELSGTPVIVPGS